MNATMCDLLKYVPFAERTVQPNQIGERAFRNAMARIDLRGRPLATMRDPITFNTAARALVNGPLDRIHDVVGCPMLL